jgi:hypothetical protein
LRSGEREGLQVTCNEEFEISQTGLSNMVRAALPLEHNAAFIWLTNQQLYWNARNNLGFGFAASHAGINMVTVHILLWRY